MVQSLLEIMPTLRAGRCPPLTDIFVQSHTAMSVATSSVDTYLTAGLLFFTAIQALAVTTSIIFLGREVRAAAFATRLNSYQSVVDGFAALESRISHDKASAHVYETGMHGLDNLDEIDFRQFSEFMATTFSLYDSMYFQYRNGVLPASLWSGWCQYMRQQLKCPGVAAWWELKRHIYPKAFADYVDGGTCPSNKEAVEKRRWLK
jgi:hypothetical protein